jgi:hypothetical protein
VVTGTLQVNNDKGPEMLRQAQEAAEIIAATFGGDSSVPYFGAMGRFVK